MRLNMMLKNELHEGLRKYASAEGRTILWTVEKAISEFLATNATKEKDNGTTKKV